MDGHFLIDNQGEPTVSVVDYKKGETIKKIQMKDPAGTNFKPGGNHHIFIIPGPDMHGHLSAMKRMFSGQLT